MQIRMYLVHIKSKFMKLHQKMHRKYFRKHCVNVKIPIIELLRCKWINIGMCISNNVNGKQCLPLFQIFITWYIISHTIVVYYFYRTDLIKGLRIGYILPIGHSVPWIQIRYLKSRKLFSIKVKELFVPIVLRRKSDRFWSFKRIFLSRYLSNVR